MRMRAGLMMRRWMSLDENRRRGLLISCGRIRRMWTRLSMRAPDGLEAIRRRFGFCSPEGQKGSFRRRCWYPSLGQKNAGRGMHGVEDGRTRLNYFDVKGPWQNWSSRVMLLHLGNEGISCRPTNLGSLQAPHLRLRH